MMSGNLHKNMNGEQGSSIFILLLVWLINTMSTERLGLIMNALDLVSKKPIEETLADLLTASDYNSGSTNMFTIDGQKAEILTDLYQKALNELPFESVTRYEWVKSSAWENGERSKQQDSKIRAEKTTVELVDGTRNFCHECGEWQGFDGLHVDIIQYCCNTQCEPMTKEVGISTDYHQTVELPWIFNGRIHEASKLELRSMRVNGESNAVQYVKNLLESGKWDDMKLRCNTNKSSPTHGFKPNGSMKKDRIYSRILRVPVLNENNMAVALWCSVPCDVDGNINTPSAIKHNGLNKANIKRIIDFNKFATVRSQLISMIEKPTKITPKMKDNIDLEPVVVSHLNRYPRTVNFNPRTVALSAMTQQKRAEREAKKMIET